jgi:hypothetical protein
MTKEDTPVPRAIFMSSFWTAASHVVILDSRKAM